MGFVGRKNTIRTKESLNKNWIKPYLNEDGSNLDSVVGIWEDQLSASTVKSLLYLAYEIRKEKGIELDIKSHLSRVGRSKQEKTIHALTLEEIGRLTPIIKASYPKLYVPYMIALHTGMRRGEVFGLRWEDIDIMKDRITINNSYGGPTKSGQTRVVPISFALEKVLLAELPECSYNRNRGNIKRKGLIIPNTFDPNPLLQDAAKDAGLREPLTFHTLRHTYGTLALESGVSPRLVSKALGHASVATTLNIYWQSTGESIPLDFLPKE